MKSPLPIAALLVLIGCTQDIQIGSTLPVEIVDLDEDAVAVEFDCDDGDPEVFPGATERCDGRDTNCDGLIDGIVPAEGGESEAVLVCAREQTFNQDMLLDLLFVVDNSASMLDAQIRVAEGIHPLIEKVIGPQLDTHIGAISTDMDDPRSRGRLVRVGDVPFASGALPLPVEDWAQQAIVVGIDGSPDERPFDAIIAALSPVINPGFRRPDAHLAIVVLSDEDDQSEATGPQFLETFRALTGPRGASIHGLIAEDADCDEVIGANLLSVIAATDGLVESICLDDYGSFLSAVGQVSAQHALNSRFRLDTPAQLGSIAVEVSYPGGLVESLDPGVDFALAADGRGLIMLGNPPALGSRLSVRWLAQPGSAE